MPATADFMFRKETGARVLSDTGIHTLGFRGSGCYKSAECIDDAVLRGRELSFSNQREKQAAEVIFMTAAVGLLWSSGSAFTDINCHIVCYEKRDLHQEEGK